MTTQEAKQKIKDAGKDWDKFIDWMNGQTIGGTPDNPNWYEYDVERFIRNN